LHVVRQAVAPLQKYGAHVCVGTLQVPPAHAPARFSAAAPAGQLTAEHVVPSAYF
jgi:hypothetical protein